MNINYEIFVSRKFLEVYIVIYKISVSDSLGLYNHNFSFVNVNIYTHIRAEILENS